MGPRGGGELDILQNIGSILIVAIGLGLAIFIHELGHLIAAKRANVKVDRFSIGFGPKLWGFVRGETEYRLSAVPLGGYVKLAGENPDEEVADDPRHFLNQKPGVRGVVYVAGVVMNMILGVVLMTLAFRLGYPIVAPEIGGVYPGSPAEQAGLEAGDVVLSIDGRSPIDAEDLLMAQVLSKPGKRVRVMVSRPGRINAVEITIIPRKQKEKGYPSWGVTQAYTMVVDAILDDSRMKGEEYIKVGDTIKSAAGKDVANWEELVAVMRTVPGKDIPAEVERDGRRLAVRLAVGEFLEYDLGVRSQSGMLLDLVVAGGAADRAGLKKGDEIVRIGDTEIHSWNQLRDVLDASGGEKVEIEVKRDGTSEILKVAPDKRLYEFVRILDRHADYLIGVEGDFSPVVGEVDEGSPAWEAGIRPGDSLTELEVTTKKDKTVRKRIEDLRGDFEAVAVSQLSQGARLSVTWERNGKEMSGPLSGGRARTLARIDILPRLPVMRLDHGLVPSVRFGLRKSYYVTVMLVKSIRSMVRGWVSPKKNLAGPIGILQISYRVAQEGVVYAMYFFGMININLAFLNLLPIPILDGGQILFVVIEKVRGRQLSQKALAIAQYVGLVMILSLIVFVLYADISRLFFS